MGALAGTMMRGLVLRAVALVLLLVGVADALSGPVAGATCPDTTALSGNGFTNTNTSCSNFADCNACTCTQTPRPSIWDVEQACAECFTMDVDNGLYVSEQGLTAAGNTLKNVQIMDLAFPTPCTPTLNSTHLETNCTVSGLVKFDIQLGGQGGGNQGEIALDGFRIPFTARRYGVCAHNSNDCQSATTFEDFDACKFRALLQCKWQAQMDPTGNPPRTTSSNTTLKKYDPSSLCKEVLKLSAVLQKFVFSFLS